MEPELPAVLAKLVIDLIPLAEIIEEYGIPDSQRLERCVRETLNIPRVTSLTLDEVADQLPPSDEPTPATINGVLALLVLGKLPGAYVNHILSALGLFSPVVNVIIMPYLLTYLDTFAPQSYPELCQIEITNTPALRLIYDHARNIGLDINDMFNIQMLIPVNWDFYVQIKHSLDIDITDFIGMIEDEDDLDKIRVAAAEFLERHNDEEAILELAGGYYCRVDTHIKTLLETMVADRNK